MYATVRTPEIFSEQIDNLFGDVSYSIAITYKIKEFFLAFLIPLELYL